MFDHQFSHAERRPYMVSSVSMPPPTAEFLAELASHATRWAYEAGEIARRYFRKVSVEYKADKTLVTEADVEIERVLFSRIHEIYPTHALLGEESGPHLANGITANERDTAYMWAIDPLDGTSAFVQGLPGWGISLGLLYHGQLVFGLFYMPLLDDLTYTAYDGVSSNQQLLGQTVRQDWAKKGYLAVTSSAHREFDLRAFNTRALGSIGANLVYTARGSATATLIPKAYLWDLAASACILMQAGGTLRYLSGKPVDYSALTDGRMIPEPIVAGYPTIVENLCQRLRRYEDVEQLPAEPFSTRRYKQAKRRRRTSFV